MSDEAGVPGKFGRQSYANRMGLSARAVDTDVPDVIAASARKLWLAVLEDAFTDLDDEATVAWIMERNHRPRGFDWLCDLMRLEADYYRRKVLAWKEGREARPRLRIPGRHQEEAA